MSEIVSLLPSAIAAAGIVAGGLNLYAGLLILSLIGPFFTILHEASPGSPIFFLWPFALCGSMAVSILSRESFSKNSLLPEGERRVFSRLTIVVIAGAVSTLFWIGKDAMSIVLDVQMIEFRKILTNQNLLLLSILIALCILVYLAVYFSVMRRREGSWCSLDVVTGMLLFYGVFQIFYTAWQSKVVFVGLDGFRYYFFMIISYFHSRYIIQTKTQMIWLIRLVKLACILAVGQLLLESHLLNVLEIHPANLPWVGYLANNFDYYPEANRAFFKGKYLPMGLMYMTHMSGLFILLGVALWMPALMAANRLRETLKILPLMLLVLLATFWTSRTVLLILVVLYVGPLILMRTSWWKFIGWGVGFAVFIFFASSHLIPGLRYDIVSEARFIMERAFPALFRAVSYDVQKVLGVQLKKNAYPDLKKRQLKNWTFLNKYNKRGDSGILSFSKDGRAANEVSFSIQAAPRSNAILQKKLYGFNKHRGKIIVVGGWFKAASQNLVRLSVFDRDVSTKSIFHSGNGNWEFIFLEHKVQMFSEYITVTLEVIHSNQETKRALVDNVYFVLDNTVTSLMFNDSGFPWERFPRLKKSDIVNANLNNIQRASVSEFYHYLFGRGAPFGSWGTLFFPERRAALKRKEVASYSDLKYLEFFELFGILGLLLLVLMGGISISTGFLLCRKESDIQSKVLVAGMTLVIVVAFLSLMHLPSLFRVGFSTTVYMMMAMLIKKSNQAQGLFLG